jgi:predicted DNA-binding protein
MRRTDAEIIEEHEKAIAEGTELEGYTRIEGAVSKNLTFSTSVRFPPEEFSRYSEAARSRGMTLSAFLRAAAEAALNSETDLDRIAAIQEARQKANELQAALARAGD